MELLTSAVFEQSYAMLHILVHYKSAYRTVESERLGLGKITPENPLIQWAEQQGFVVIDRRGIVPDKRAIKEFCRTIPRTSLGEYRNKLENVTLTFPIAE